MKRPAPELRRRVVGYVRISRDRPNETSTTTQEESIRAYCAAHGWHVVDIVVEPGRSAFKSSRARRPGFDRARSFIAGGAADTFMVWKLDRAARNTLDLLTFVRDDLAKHGAEFVSVTESFDTSTPMGRAMLTIVAALAEMESAQKSERAREWHEHRRATVATPSGRPPVGFVRERPNTLDIDPVLGPVVRQAMLDVLGGASIRSVLASLENQGVSLTRPGFMSVLRNPTMAGLRVTGESKGQPVLEVGGWEGLISRDEWERLQVAIGGRSTSPGHNRLRHPLRPLIRCHCGSTMRVHNDTRQYSGPRYVCEGARCKNGILQAPVDELVVSTILGRLDDSSWRALRASGEASGPDPVAVEAQLSRMWQLVLAGQLDVTEYSEAKALWQGRLAQAGQQPLPNVESVVRAWPSFSPMEQHLVFRAAIRSLVIGPAVRRGRGVDLGRVQLVLVD